jgi:TonB C terminal
VRRGTIEIGEFDPNRGAACGPELHGNGVALDPLSRLRLRYRTATSAAVALAVVALHTVAIIPAFGSSGAASNPLPQFGTPDPVQALLIDDQSTSAITSPTLSAPVLRPIHVNLPDVPGPNSAAPGLAALYGRYLAQMDARIDRAWLRPRTAIGAPMFRCEAEVWQRRDGTVRTVTLHRCNGTGSWQQSLVLGIDAASPLPAPPDPRVFANRVILHFEAVAYRPGQPADQYQPIRPSSAPASDSGFSEALGQIRSMYQGAKTAQSRSIELRIEGTHVEVRPAH